MFPTMRLTVEPGDVGPAMARAFVRACIVLLGRQPSDEAVLLTSEAVTNSIRHTQTETVEVSLESFGDRIRIGVADDDSHEPVVLPLDPTRLGGLGVRLIDDLSEEWGVEERVDEGKLVWFDVFVPATT